MATVKQFEDLICWQKARELANFVYDVTDNPSFKDFVLKNHIRKTVISPMSNIAEGFDRGTRNEFVDALFIAKGEVGEAKSQLYLAGDRRYIEMSKYRYGLALCDECSRLIQSFADKVKSSGRAGLQFKRVPREDTWLQKAMQEQGLVFTGQGVMKKEEAERLGLEPFS